MLTDAAATVVALAAVATALGVLCRLRPVRWVGRTLIGQPVLAAFRREVIEVVRSEVPAVVAAELAKHPITNGWGVKMLQAVGDATGADMPPPPQHPEDADPGAPTEGDTT